MTDLPFLEAFDGALDHIYRGTVPQDNRGAMFAPALYRLTVRPEAVIHLPSGGVYAVARQGDGLGIPFVRGDTAAALAGEIYAAFPEKVQSEEAVKVLMALKSGGVA